MYKFTKFYNPYNKEEKINYLTKLFIKKAGVQNDGSSSFFG